MKKLLIALPLLGLSYIPVYAKGKVVNLASPDGNITAQINVGDEIIYNINADGKPVLKDCRLAMQLQDVCLGKNPKLKKVSKTSVDEIISPVVPLKFSEVNNRYNGAILKFADGYDVEFRAFDNGVAYRFVTHRNDSVNVVDETFMVNLADSATVHLQQPASFRSGYEEPYSHMPSGNWTENERMSVLPVLVEGCNDHLVLISESGLSDYPCMFLQGYEGDKIGAVFPKAPAKTEQEWDRWFKVVEEHPYIARTAGSRAFPWRYMVISDNPSDLLTQTLTYQLAGDCEIDDTSWIKPGQTSWDWFNGKICYGPDVDFQYGTNTDTYKYFIDFAAKNGVEYVILDEGWAKWTEDPYGLNPDIDLAQIISYGKEKGVGIILWMTWVGVDKNPDIFERFADMGVAGMKIDFMDRSDQWMVNFYERTMREAAKHHLLVDFHGSFKPAGLEHRYPNLLSYEGVLGLEQMGRCTPDNSLYLPFMRNSVGPMDFTPGAMLNQQPDCYASAIPNAASVGTRAFQLATYVVFESGIQMLADSPTRYKENPDCTEFIVNTPVTWDETRVLDSKIGQYVVVAKRKGADWYIGALTNDNPRHFELPLDFLGSENYEITSFADGPNASRQGMDYRKTNGVVNPSQTLTIDMARNGGFAAVLKAR